MRVAMVLAAFLGAPLAAQMPPLGQAAESIAGATTASTLDGITRPVASRFRPVPEVHLQAGAQAKVERGTRCYYDDRADGYSDAVERGGDWYCEPGGAIVASTGSR